MAALAADSKSLRNTLQLAFCHLFFNITGILIFYPIPFMRFPIPMAKCLGRTTAKYRWFSIFYLFAMFFMLPFTIFALSWAGKWVFVSVATPFAIIVFTATIVNIIQSKRPSWLPIRFQDWDWLPYEWMHSLDPIDNLLLKIGDKVTCLSCCCPSAESRHDADALGIRANQSQLHILEAASKNMSVSETNLMLHNLNSFNNQAFDPWSNNHHHTIHNGLSNSNCHSRDDSPDSDSHHFTWHGSRSFFNSSPNGDTNHNGHLQPNHHPVYHQHLQIPTSSPTHVASSSPNPESTKL